MAEEPRRSGRATKGVNPKNQEEAPEPQPPKPQKKSTAKSSKAKAAANDKEEDEEEGVEEVIRCVCGSDDDNQRTFVSCESCDVWQHNDCMGVPGDPDELEQYLKARFKTDKYFCEQCKPQNHKELLAAIERGERPWEEAAKQRKAAKGKKGGRSHKANGTPEVKPPPKSASPAQHVPPVQENTAEPSRTERGKRKLATDNEIEADSQPSKMRRSSGSTQPEISRQSMRKSASVTTPTAESTTPQSHPSAIMVKHISEIENEQRKRTATYLQGKFESAIKELEKRGDYRIPTAINASSIAETQAIAVEYSMFSNYANSGPKPDFTGSYKSQMQAIGSNIVQNSSLMSRLLSQAITPDQLSKMSSNDMASEELQKQMESMKKEAEKQAMLVNDDSMRPMVRRTHKGEELVDDSSNHMASESIASAAPPRRRESNLDGPESPSIDQSMTDAGFSEGSPKRFDKPLTVDTNRSPAGGDSARFDVNTVWSSIKSPGSGQSPRIPNNHSRTGSYSASHQPPIDQPAVKTENSQHEADIDRLLEEDENDSAPYSPQEYIDSDIVWRGFVDMPIPGGSVAQFKAESRHVAGTDLQSKLPSLASIYPEKLEISGRIAKDRAEQYLTSLSASRSTDVTVHSLRPVEHEQGKGQAEFEKLFKYFTQRSRYGVVADSLHRPNVSDVYLIPLDAGLQNLPSFLERLEYNTVQSPPSQPLLLVVFILKWKSGAAPPTPATVNTTEQTPAALTPPVLPPSAGSAMSPGSQSMSYQQQQFQPLPIPPQSQQAPPISSNAYPPQHHDVSLPPPHNVAPVPGQPQVGSDLYLQNFDVVKQVLGDLINCATAQKLLAQTNTPMTADTAQSLKLVFEREPVARDDWEVFERVLAKQTSQVA